MSIYKIIRLVPYLVLVLLGFGFILAYKTTTSEMLKTIFISLSSSSFFVVIAYFFYDIIKSFIDKHESKYIDSYIKNQISHDVFIVLYALKKYIHGYNLETNTVKNIFELSNYSKEQIESSVVNQFYLGFQIFKEIEDIKGLFQDAMNNDLIIRYSSRNQVINLLKISNLISQVEHIFRNENHYIKSPEKAFEFFCINAKHLNPQNEESQFLLLKKTKVPNRAIVYDSGRFDQSKENSLLNKYVMKPEIASIAASQIYELNRHLSFWLPEEFYIGRYSKYYRIIKDYFSPFTNAFIRTKRIYVADIIESKK